MSDAFSNADAYERFMGRWSRLLNRSFVPWLGVRKDASWLDVGCGTGSLSQTVLDIAWPGAVTGIDPSEAFVEQARRRVRAARFEVGSAERLPFPDASFDAAAASLVLHFAKDPAAAAREMLRVARPGGTGGATVWDTAGGMEMLAQLAAAAPDFASEGPDASPLGRPGALASLFRAAGFADVASESLAIPMLFDGFDDFWEPFLGAAGPAGAYVAGLDPDAREALRLRLRDRLPAGPDGSIRLTARAWAVRGRRPAS